MALQLDSYNTSACFQFGELYEVLGLPWRAVALYKRILEMDPQHAKAAARLEALEGTKPAEKSEPSSFRDSSSETSSQPGMRNRAMPLAPLPINIWV